MRLPVGHGAGLAVFVKRHSQIEAAGHIVFVELVGVGREDGVVLKFPHQDVVAVGRAGIEVGAAALGQHVGDAVGLGGDQAAEVALLLNVDFGSERALLGHDKGGWHQLAHVGRHNQVGAHAFQGLLGRGVGLPDFGQVALAGALLPHIHDIALVGGHLELDVAARRNRVGVAVAGRGELFFLRSGGVDQVGLGRGMRHTLGKLD